MSNSACYDFKKVKLFDELGYPDENFSEPGLALLAFLTKYVK